MKNIPDPNKVFPNEKLPDLCYIKNVVKNPNIIIGDYTYYYGDDADQFEKHVTHHYPFIGDKLIIGKFCAIAKGVEFVMNGANHRMNCVTTYPFYIMGGDWGNALAPVTKELPLKGDTVVGNDVWIGAISLLVGGIGVMNIMLVSVTERTREIGIRMAIGATSWNIRMQFLGEAVTLSCMGGLIGIILGVGVTFLVSKYMSLQTSLSVWAVLVSAGFSAATGVFFGFYPVYKASKLTPIDALRYE